jgi:hypothetical protein
MPAESILIAPARCSPPLSLVAVWSERCCLGSRRGCLSQQRTRRVRCVFDNPFHRTVALCCAAVNGRSDFQTFKAKPLRSTLKLQAQSTSQFFTICSCVAARIFLSLLVQSEPPVSSGESLEAGYCPPTRNLRRAVTRLQTKSGGIRK